MEPKGSTFTYMLAIKGYKNIVGMTISVSLGSLINTRTLPTQSTDKPCRYQQSGLRNNAILDIITSLPESTMPLIKYRGRIDQYNYFTHTPFYPCYRSLN